MRFAGSRIQDFMSDGPDMGEIALNADTRSTEYQMAGTKLSADVGATGITQAGEVEAAGILADAKAGLAGAQANAAGMEAIGGIASSALGAFGSSSGATSSAGGFSGSPILTSNTDYSGAFTGPSWSSSFNVWGS